MKRLKQSHTKTLIFALLLSIGFVLGILGIIFGAVNGMTWLLVIGIIATVMGFYGAPLVWIRYGEQSSYLAVLECIEIDNIFVLDDIANNLGKKPREILGRVNYLISKRYLTGYLLVDQKYLKPIEENKEVVVTHKCPYCGATLSVGENISSCEYCGAKLKIHSKKKA